MNEVVNSILLFVISAQIACTGSDNLPPVFSDKTGFTVSTHVTGVAALMKSAYKELTSHDFDTLIVSGEIFNDVGSDGRDDHFGYGWIDEAKAKQWAERLASGESLSTITSTAIRSVNQDDLYSYTVTTSDVDSDAVSSAATFANQSNDFWLGFDENTGELTGIPTNYDVDDHEVTITAVDGKGGRDTQSFSLTVSNTNDAPVISEIDDRIIREDYFFRYIPSASDVDGDTLSFSLNDNKPSWLAIFDSKTGELRGTPTNDDVGDHEVTITADDGNGGTDTQSFTLTVSNTNDAPTIISEVSDAIIDEGKVYNYTVSANDIDAGDSLTLTATVSKDGTKVTNSWLSLIDASDGNWLLSGTPTNDDAGDHEVTITADDGKGGTDTQSFTLTVSNTNDASVISEIEDQTVKEDDPYSFTPTTTDDDITDIFRFSLSDNKPSWLEIDSETGELRGIPTNDDVGDHEVTITADDGNGGTDTQSFTLTVSNTNDAPVISKMATESQLYQGVTVTVSDIEGDTVSLTTDILTESSLLNLYQKIGELSGPPNNLDISNDVGDYKVTITFNEIATDLIATESQLYQGVTVTASDVDAGDTVSLTADIPTESSWLNFNQNTGELSGTPTNNDVGEHTVVIKADDGNGGTDTQSFTLTVRNVNAHVELDNFSSDLGFKIIGAREGDESGASVSAGDINGDGIDDLIISAPYTDFVGDSNSTSISYVVYGQKGKDISEIDLKEFSDNNTNGFKIIGEEVDAWSGDQHIWNVSGAGDINGDGYDDLIIGAPYAASPDATDIDDTSYGTSYVIYGSADGQDIQLNTLSTSDGFKIFSASSSDHSGWSVSGAGDINGDGYDDLIIGAPGASVDHNTGYGAGYVMYGQKENRHKDVNLSAFDGFVITGVQSAHNKFSGADVSSAGDINGDGYDDLIIGERFINVKGSNYVVYGSDRNSRDNVDFNDFTASDGFIINGEFSSGFNDFSVSGAGDINGDGYDDLIIGAPKAEPDDQAQDYNSGISYVVYGQEGATRGEIDLNTFPNEDYTDGFKIIGAKQGDQSGTSVSGAADINGDGFDDLIIGAPEAGGKAGISYVVYGQKGKDRGQINLNTFTNEDYTDGFKINGVATNDKSGTSVSAGDINGDGFDDLIIGAPKAGSANGDDSGISYVVYGNYSEHKSEGETRTNIGTYRADDLELATNDRVLIGGAGDDALDIHYITSYERIDGGNGTDTLVFRTDGSLDFTGNDPSFRPTSIQDIEVIDMTSGGTLSLRPIDVLNLSTTSNELTVRGGNLHLYQGPTDGAGWHKDSNGNWANYVNNAVIKIEDDSVNVDDSKLMETIENEFDTIRVLESDSEKRVNFGEVDNKSDGHYLTLDERVFDGLTELTIEIEFELDFTRASKTEHAYLLSLAEKNSRANMLKIFLKDRDHSSEDVEGPWDLSIWAQNDDKANGNAGDDQKFFLKENWIKENQRVVLWVAIDLAGDGNVSVYWQDKSNDASVPERQELGNKCPSSHNQCGGKWSDIDMLKVGLGGAVFGNDQDSLARKFDYRQAFEGEFYGLKIYDKFFDLENEILLDANLIYSVSPGNIKDD